MSETGYRFAIGSLSDDKGGGHLIDYPDLPGCMSEGETIEDAIANGRDAKAAWIAAMGGSGHPVPLPGGDAAEGYSGKWQLRTAKSLQRDLAHRASREGVALNTLTLQAQAQGLGTRAAGRRDRRHVTT